MTTYFIEFDVSTRYRCAVTAAGPAEAIEQFWLHENDGLEAHNAIEVDYEGPTGLSMTDTVGRSIVWGERTDLS